MPHIWLPYKILGEVQSVFVYYSANQLGNQQLSALIRPKSAQKLQTGITILMRKALKPSKASRALALPDISKIKHLSML